MTHPPLTTVLQHLRGLAGEASTEGTDGALLRRFAEQRDEGAFNALAVRHGPLVWDVCRHVLHDTHDTEDAFQATLLVLACRAGSIRKHESAASWLHGVAYRIALRARTDAARRRTREREAQSMSSADPSAEAATREARAAVHEELQHLPPRWRDALVLFYLEGHSYEETARLLRCPLGTVRSRLARGREWLRRRLARRGLALSAACLAVAQPAPVAATSAATWLGRSARALALAQQALLSMSTTTLKSMLALLLAVAMLATGAGLLGHRAAAEKPAPPGARIPDPAPPVAPLPPGAVARIGTTRFAAGSTVETVAFAPGGKVVASGHGDHTIRLWDAVSGKELRRLVGHADPVTGLTFSPDGKLLASRGGSIAFNDNSIRLWDVASGKEVRRFGRETLKPLPTRSHYGSTSWAFAVVFSPDGKFLASGAGDTENNDGTVRLWDVATGKESRALKGHDGKVRAYTFSPDGKTLATAGADGKVILWDLGSKRWRRLEAHKGDAWSVAFSADGKTLASAGADKMVRLWDAATGKELRVLKNLSPVKAVCFSPDGRTLAWGDHNVIRLLDVRDPKGKERRLGGQGYGVSWLAFAADSKTLAAVAEGQDYAVCLWDTATGKQLSPLPGGHHKPVAYVGFGPGGKLLVSAGEDATMRFWDPRTGRELRRLKSANGGIYYVSLSPDGKTVVAGAGDGSLRLYETATGKERGVLRLREGQLCYPAFSPDGKTLAASWNRFDPAARRHVSTPCLFAVATGKELRRCLGHHVYSIRALAFTADGKTLVSGGEDNRVHLWDVSSGKEDRCLTGHTRWVLTVACSPDGDTIASGDGQFIRLWQASTGKELACLTHEGVASIRFSPDGRTLVSGGYDRTVRLWDVATCKQRRRFLGHDGLVQTVAISDDGRLVASGGRDALILLWDVTGRLRNGRLQMEELAPADLEGLWSDLGSADAARAHRAIWTLATTPRQALPWLAQRVRTRRADPEVQRHIARLIVDLDSDRFAVRERASEGLARLGETARPALQRALAGKPAPEARRRLEDLLRKLPREEESPEKLRLPRVVEVLEHIGTREARRLLKDLAGGEEPRLAHEARASLERLERRPAP
jgi:RNA polymerase sigma factor (sigma-70 family)